MSVGTEGYKGLRSMSADTSANIETLLDWDQETPVSIPEYAGPQVLEMDDADFEDDEWSEVRRRNQIAQASTPSTDATIIDQLIAGEIAKFSATERTSYLDRPVVDSPEKFTIDNHTPTKEIDEKVRIYARMKLMSTMNLVDIEPLPDQEQGGCSRSYIATRAEKDPKTGEIIEHKYFIKALLLANEDTKNEGQLQKAIAKAVEAQRARAYELAKKRGRRLKLQSESPVPHAYGTHIERTSDGSYLPIIVMEFIEGKPLYKELANPSVSQLRKLHLIERLARALGEMHVAGYVHLDVKGENAMLQPNDNIKLLDFSLAAKIGEKAKAEGVTGTIQRMSPEHFQKSRDPRSDVYSVGRILYKALTGEETFAELDQYLGPGGSSTQEYSNKLYAAMINNEHFKNASPGVKEALYGLSGTLVGILYNATAGKPEDRFVDCLALANSLKHAEDEYTERTYKMLEPGIVAASEERARKYTPANPLIRAARAVGRACYRVIGGEDIIKVLERAKGKPAPDVADVTAEETIDHRVTRELP